MLSKDVNFFLDLHNTAATQLMLGSKPDPQIPMNRSANSRLMKHARIGEQGLSFLHSACHTSCANASTASLPWCRTMFQEESALCIGAQSVGMGEKK